MNLRSLTVLAASLTSLLALAAAHAQSTAPTPTDLRAAAEALFDRAADVLAKDPAAAKPLFARAALAFERLLDQPLSAPSRARILSNAGAAHHLAGDPGHAILDFRRADIACPATPDLRDRLAAARAVVRSDAPGATTTSSAPAPADKTDSSLPELARDLALSAPRTWLWRSAAISYVVLWSAFLLRLVIPLHRSGRPGAWILAPLGAVLLLSAGLLVTMHFRDHHAASQAVVISDCIGRSEPDDLTGSPSGSAPLKPGTELTILEQRAGGDGRPWIRVAPADSEPAPGEQPLWIPAAAAPAVLDAR